MRRIAIFLLLCSTCLAERPAPSSTAHAPWVSCFADSGEWLDVNTVRTPIVTSADGSMRAFAEIRAQSRGQMDCENTVRLLVSRTKSSGFRQVFRQAPSTENGTADSLAPVAWSPNGRWLLVELGDWCYGCDGGGTEILLYDNRKQTILRPDIRRMLKAALKRDCSIVINGLPGFDPSSRVRMRLEDSIDEGDDVSQNPCLHGSEEWLFDPVRLNMRPASSAK